MRCLALAWKDGELGLPCSTPRHQRDTPLLTSPNYIPEHPLCGACPAAEPYQLPLGPALDPPCHCGGDEQVQPWDNTVAVVSKLKSVFLAL